MLTEGQNRLSTPTVPLLTAISTLVDPDPAEDDFRALYAGVRGESQDRVLQNALSRICGCSLHDREILERNLYIIPTTLILAGQYPAVHADLLADLVPLWYTVGSSSSD